MLLSEVEVAEVQSRESKTHRFWRDVGTWLGGMVSIIVASFIYSRFDPSYHNPFFKDPVGMAIMLGIPTIGYWCWTSRRFGQREP